MARSAAFEAEALRALAALGVRDARPGEPGVIPLRAAPLAAPEVVVRRVTPTTGPVWRGLNARAAYKARVRRVAAQALPCFGLLPCSLRPLCCSKSYADPVIAFQHLPTRVPHATLYLNPLNLRIEGATTQHLDNQGQEGTVTTTCQCRNGEDGTQPVPGSADLSTQAQDGLVEHEVQQLITQAEAAFQGVTPGASVEQDVTFKTTGLLEVLRNVLTIWTGGFALFDSTLNVTASWNWLGTTQNQAWQVERSVRVPVQSLGYAW